MTPATMVPATKLPPSKEQWLSLRPEIAYWYLHKHRTAVWITNELRSRGLIVTNKMLRDRFREWKFPLKYNRKRQDEVGGRDEVAIDLAVSRAIATSPEDAQLTSTLSVIGHFLDEICDAGSWRWIDSNQGVQIQRLAASAHMTITTYNTECPARYDELFRLGNQVADALTQCQNASIMHPRVLTALLRLLVDNYTTEIESNALAVVKRMFQILSNLKLPEKHPVRLLCQMNKPQSSLLLKRFLLLTESQFYDKISDADPNFTMREQVYTARVLASVGRMEESIELLMALLKRYESQVDVFTLADAHRTLGYANKLRGSLDEAQYYATMSIQGFEAAGAAFSDNAMYAHISLASIHHTPGHLCNLSAAEHHASATLRIWEGNFESNKGMGGIKIVKDLHEILLESGKNEEAGALQRKYPTFFGGG